MYTNILVATDGSALSGKAVEAACRLAAAVGAKITGFYAKPAFSAPVYAEGAAFGNMIGRARFDEQSKAHADEVLAQVRTEAKKSGVDAALMSESSTEPYEAIIKAAQSSGCDLIVMASHGRRGIKRLLMGSETMQVLTHSHIPVLVLR